MASGLPRPTRFWRRIWYSADSTDLSNASRVAGMACVPTCAGFMYLSWSSIHEVPRGRRYMGEQTNADLVSSALNRAMRPRRPGRTYIIATSKVRIPAGLRQPLRLAGKASPENGGRCVLERYGLESLHQFRVRTDRETFKTRTEPRPRLTNAKSYISESSWMPYGSVPALFQCGPIQVSDGIMHIVFLRN